MSALFIGYIVMCVFAHNVRARKMHVALLFAHPFAFVIALKLINITLFCFALFVLFIACVTNNVSPCPLLTIILS